MAAIYRERMRQVDGDPIGAVPSRNKCPGPIREDASIEKGGHNLPGNWEHKGFNLAQLLCRAIPAIDGHNVVVLMHDDAVVQGLSEAPFVRDVEH